MSWIPPVTDRTQTDVDFANANRNDPANYKGAQNNTDWQRLTSNMYHLAGVLRDYGYDVILHSRLVWDVGYIPRDNEVYQILEDLVCLRHALLGYFNYSWQQWDGLGRNWAQIDSRKRMSVDYFSSIWLPRMPMTYYEKINILEEWTRLLLEAIEQTKPLLRVSGTFSSGQATYLPRFIDVELEYMDWIGWDSLLRAWTAIDLEQKIAADYFKKV